MTNHFNFIELKKHFCDFYLNFLCFYFCFHNKDQYFLRIRKLTICPELEAYACFTLKK